MWLVQKRHHALAFCLCNPDPDKWIKNGWCATANMIASLLFRLSGSFCSVKGQRCQHVLQLVNSMNLPVKVYQT